MFSLTTIALLKASKLRSEASLNLVPETGQTPGQASSTEKTSEDANEKASQLLPVALRVRGTAAATLHGLHSRRSPLKNCQLERI